MTRCRTKARIVAGPEREELPGVGDADRCREDCCSPFSPDPSEVRKTAKSAQNHPWPIHDPVPPLAHLRSVDAPSQMLLDIHTLMKNSHHGNPISILYNEHKKPTHCELGAAHSNVDHISHSLAVGPGRCTSPESCPCTGLLGRSPNGRRYSPRCR